MLFGCLAGLGSAGRGSGLTGFSGACRSLRRGHRLKRFRPPDFAPLGPFPAEVRQHVIGEMPLFMSALFGRTLDSERPHLGPGLVWLPAIHRWRLESLARLIVPYPGEHVVERGIA